jgi:DNA-binding NarL/FixJ family response regulator
MRGGPVVGRGREVIRVSEQLTLFVQAGDPVSQAGVVAALRDWHEVRVVDECAAAEVGIVVTDEVDDDAIRMLKSVQRNGCPRVVLVATRIDDHGLVAAVEAGISGVVRRNEATGMELVRLARLAAAGDGSVPPDLLGRLLREVGRVQRQVLTPRGLTFTGLSKREISVLRLVADGLDTSEIARHLSYSERTIKNVIHDVTSRLHLRNRSQAVAYAMREGLL